MADKGKQPKKEMGAIEKFRAGVIDKFTVSVVGRKPPKVKEKRKGHNIRWLSHNEMLMHHKRIKRRRRRNEIAKESRRANR